MQYISLQKQRGITMLESMVAIVVAGLGILGILGVQMRTLTDTQTTVRRAQAVHLIEDLSERLKIHPNALMNIGSYTVAWNTALPASPPVNCRTSTCTHAQWAAYDLWAWRTLVRDTLPAADASVFIAAGEGTPENRRQLGIMISWRANERVSPGDADATAYLNPVDATRAGSGGGTGGAVACPPDRVCHLQYIPVSARCAPYLMGPTPQYFCPGPKV